MRVRTFAIVAMLVVASTFGCSRTTWDHYVATGDPGWSLHRDIQRSKAGFDRVENGMTVREVTDLVGNPTSRSADALYWEFGEYRDAWVFLGADERVTSRYWQDETSLRLGEVPPVAE